MSIIVAPIYKVQLCNIQYLVKRYYYKRLETACMHVMEGSSDCKRNAFSAHPFFMHVYRDKSLIVCYIVRIPACISLSSLKD